MNQNIRQNQKDSAGFSLVEIMVALVIGMFGVLIMMQVFQATESQKRTTTSGNDALNDGVQALYAVQGDVRMAGFGITDPKILGCSLTLKAGVTLPALVPVTIFPAGAAFPAFFPAPDANTDGLFLFSSNSNGTTLGDTVNASPNQMLTRYVFSPADWVINAPIARVDPCALTLNRVANANSAVVAPANPTVDVVNLNGAVVNLIGGLETLFNLGRTYRAVGYAVRNGNLTMCDYYSAPAFPPVAGFPAIPATPGVDCSLPGNWVSIASNIVSMRAQYGRDTAGVGAMDGIVDVYDQALPPVLPVAPATTFCAWTRIEALRFVLVARSVQFEALNGVPTIVTQQAPPWDGSAGNAINLTSDPNWTSYRYKTFQTTVPLRNSNWMGVGPGQATPAQSVLQSSGATC